MTGRQVGAWVAVLVGLALIVSLLWHAAFFYGFVSGGYLFLVLAACYWDVRRPS